MLIVADWLTVFVFDCLTQKPRYQSLTKTRRYVYQGQLHTRRTSRVIISGAEVVEQCERETRFTVILLMLMLTQYLSMRKSCKQSCDSCAMRVVFSRLQNCPGFSGGDFRDGRSAFQHVGPETAKTRQPYVTVLVRRKSR